MKSKLTVLENGTQLFKVGEIFHREDGPAVILCTGEERWYICGRWVKSTRAYCEAVGMSGEDTMLMLLKYGDSLIHPNDVIKYGYVTQDDVIVDVQGQILSHLKELAFDQYDEYSKANGYQVLERPETIIEDRVVDQTLTNTLEEALDIYNSMNYDAIS